VVAVVGIVTGLVVDVVTTVVVVTSWFARLVKM
jgi:hypothetical protein